MKTLATRLKEIKRSAAARIKESHPEDAKIEVKATAEGKEKAPSFCAQHGEWFVALIATYADQDACDLLDELREHFWIGDWQDGKRRGTR